MAPVLFQALASAADGAFIVRQDQHIIYWNRAAERALGYMPREMHGRPCYELLNGQDGSDRPICRQRCAVARAALGGNQVPSFDMSVRTRGGAQSWINISTLVFPANGEGSGPVVVHLFRDITHEKKTEQLLHKILTAAERLQDKAQASPLPRSPANGTASELTDRESEVLSLLARGSSTGDIAGTLCVSPFTVRNHIRNILGKCQAHSHIEAVVYALKHGLVTLD